MHTQISETNPFVAKIAEMEIDNKFLLIISNKNSNSLGQEID